ncbi:MAG: helix-turn-helix transcriptional regulator [Ruminococcaceae bacterium]|nr:helix-turn-helix transcriptional regulator [Oscillospiraceae bacterium]
MNLKDKILFYRKKAGMSQETLAEKLDVSRQAVSKWETGEALPDLNNLVLLAKTFNTTTDHLLSDEEADGAHEVKQEEKQAEKTEEKKEKCAPLKESWLDNLIKGIKNIFNKYGWLTGVYLAVVGAITTGMGLLAKFISNMLFTHKVSHTLPGYNVIFDAFGNQTSVNPSEIAFDIKVINPVDIISTVMIVIGVTMLIGGIVLAVVLKKRNKNR